MKAHRTNRKASGRAGERGAALITALLISMLMLVAGGALLATTTMTVGNTVDTTAEAQAYYAAEAGIQSAMSVLRGNVAARGGLTLPLNTKMRGNFRVANMLTTSNAAGDVFTEARLSGWLPYNGTTASARVPVSTDPGNQLFYSLSITDPADSSRATLTTSPTYNPARLIITSTGYGPRGSVKQMQVLVKRTSFDFDPKSTLLMTGNVSSFNIGNSNAKGYSGIDQSNATNVLPAFGFTSGSSTTSITANTFNCGSANCNKAKSSTSDPETATITNSDLPSWLQTPQAAAAFLDDVQAQANSMGRYFATKDGQSVSGGLGTSSDPKVTFVDGDFSTSGSGNGLLVVTGNLTFSGNFSFDGLILVLGSYRDASNNLQGGTLSRNGGGNGAIAGAIVVASFDRANPTSFLNTSLDTSGGGNSDILFDSTKVNNALTALGSRVLGVVEN
jgi:hypothetical protein